MPVLLVVRACWLDVVVVVAVGGSAVGGGAVGGGAVGGGAVGGGAVGGGAVGGVAVGGGGGGGGGSGCRQPLLLLVMLIDVDVDVDVDVLCVGCIHPFSEERRTGKERHGFVRGVEIASLLPSRYTYMLTLFLYDRPPPLLLARRRLCCTSPPPSTLIIQGWEAAREKVSLTLLEVCGRGHDPGAVKRVIRGM